MQPNREPNRCESTSGWFGRIDPLETSASLWHYTPRQGKNIPRATASLSFYLRSVGQLLGRRIYGEYNQSISGSHCSNPPGNPARRWIPATGQDGAGGEEAR